MENGRSDRIQELKYWLNVRVKYPWLLEELKKAVDNHGQVPVEISKKIHGNDLDWVIGMVGPMDNGAQT